MPLLHRFRHLAPGPLGRAVLAWFLLSLGVAVASPLVNPQALELVCSGAGVMKLSRKRDAIISSGMGWANDFSQPAIKLIGLAEVAGALARAHIQLLAFAT